MGEVTVISDFDGTISRGDFPIILLDTFCKLDWRELDHRFRQGEMTLHELIHTEVRNLDIDQEGLAEFAKKTIKFRPGFWEFYNAVMERNFNLIILSEGLKEYIAPFFRDSNVAIYANECNEEDDGSLTLITPYEDDECKDCGNCKKNIVESFIEKEDFVIYIGDGESDYCAAQYANLRFARGPLAKHLERKHLEFVLFEDFFDVLEIIERTG